MLAVLLTRAHRCSLTLLMRCHCRCRHATDADADSALAYAADISPLFDAAYATADV